MSHLVPPSPFVPPAPGEVIRYGNKSYYIGQQIGRGYYGTVYECWDDWNNELVAKTLAPTTAENQQAQRASWLDELHKLVTLRHPRITYLYDAFEYQGIYYLIIERCSYTLASVISSVASQKHPVAAGELWIPHLARDVLQALYYMHSASYVHKDIHAHNIFIKRERDSIAPQKDPVWSFKVGDLGISRLVGDINVFNTMLAPWMLPPEHLHPTEFGLVGTQTDIYHVSLLLLQVLTGTAHFDFSHEQIVQGYPGVVASSVRSRYAPVLARALRRHVAARTPDALTFWREIQAVNHA